MALLVFVIAFMFLRNDFIVCIKNINEVVFEYTLFSQKIGFIHLKVLFQTIVQYHKRIFSDTYFL